MTDNDNNDLLAYIQARDEARSNMWSRVVGFGFFASIAGVGVLIHLAAR